MERKGKRQGRVFLIFLLTDAIGIHLGLKISLIQAWFYDKMSGSPVNLGFVVLKKDFF